MAQLYGESQIFSSQNLQKFCRELLLASGLNNYDADLVSESLIESNLRGIDSHGIGRLPHYLNRIKHCSINPNPKIKIDRVAKACAIVDGDHGLGQVVMCRASDEAITIARETGTGWVAVKQSSHCGALAYYGLRIAEQSMLGLVFTHVDPMVLPHGSRKPFCGTNPICIAVAGIGNDHLCLDMATSSVPWNTIANATTENLTIPRGWGVDGEGNDTTDPQCVTALFPFGGYKGSGLGLMIDVLCALLSAAPYGPDIPKMYGDPTQYRMLGGLVGAIDISKFTDSTDAAHRISEIIHRWTCLTPMQSDGHVLYPGQPESTAKRERLTTGIPLGLELCKILDNLAAEYQIQPLARI